MSNKLSNRSECNYGHQFTTENTYFRKDGGRECRQCRVTKRANLKAKMTVSEIEFRKSRDAEVARRRKQSLSADELEEKRRKERERWHKRKEHDRERKRIYRATRTPEQYERDNKLQAFRRVARHNGLDIERDQIFPDMLDEDMSKLDDKITAPWNQLIPTDREQPYLDRLNRVLDAMAARGERTRCFDNPGPYSDYTVQPTPEVARDLCRDCPALHMCRDYGKVARLEWKRKGRDFTGVFGGVVVEAKEVASVR